MASEIPDLSIGILTKERLRGPPHFRSLPHVVILGAGASKAAFPNGDKNGKPLPLMDELPGILGGPWVSLIEKTKPPVAGFEAQFSWIRRGGAHISELQAIERIIEQYFAELKLPDTPTIYDYLVLGLRPKDVVATFNWDPLLLQAIRRNRQVADLPDVRFLHGCVAYATCQEHDVLGVLSEACPECRKPLVKGQLFYPDSDKDYTRDSVVYRDWTAVAVSLQEAFHLTIFGYSGPQTDFAARKLLLGGWSRTKMKEISHVEIIDLKDEEELIKNWKEFIPFNHDMVTRDFWSSTIARWPRRTQDYKLFASLYGVPAEYLGPLRTDSLAELQNWHREIAAAEKRKSDSKS
jgi:hypothetical protein